MSPFKVLPTFLGITNKHDHKEYASREFEDRVAKMLRRLGFEVHQRVLVPIARRVYHEVDQICLSNELPRNDGGGAEVRKIWVETKLKQHGGHVGKGVLLRLFGAFSCLAYKEYDESRCPDAIWVVTNGKFSSSAWDLAMALNEGLGRELFVLVDGNRLKKLLFTHFRSA